MIPHGSHIYAKASDMENTTMCAYPHSDHALPHWKCVLRCCADCPCINLPDHETKSARQIVEEVVVIGRMEDQKFKVKYVISNPL